MQTVRVYDFKTKQVTEIPVSELSSEVVRANVEGVEGDVYVYAEESRIGPPKHSREQFKPMLPTIEKVRQTFMAVWPRSLNEWVDGFRSDTHPEKEIAIWVKLANLYRAILKGRKYTGIQRKEVFNILLQASMGGTADEILARTSHKKLGRDGAIAVLEIIHASRNADDSGDDS